MNRLFKFVLISSAITTFLLPTRQVSGVPAQEIPRTATVLDGVYTTQQAESGESAYERTCSRCHEGSEPDGPALFGRTFIDRWREDTLDNLYTHIKTRMPVGAAGSLTGETYIDILAFILRGNGYPDGNNALKEAVIAEILLHGEDGPKPLPNNTLVSVAGCLKQTAEKAWTIVNATEVTRTRQGDTISPEELARARQRPPGNRTFVLQSFVNAGANPAAFEDTWIQIKGVLNHQAAPPRINVTSIATVSSTCAGQAP